MPPEEQQFELCMRADGMHLRSLRESTREADFVASTDTVDSWDEIVEQKWRLDRFLKNPVVLYAHNSRDLPIGQATRVEMVDVVLECTIKFVSEAANPLAEKVWLLLQQKALRAVSVGFMPNEFRWEMREGKEILVLSDNELREISVVPIPANPDALAKMKARAKAAASTTNTTTKETAVMTEKEMLERVAKAEAEKALADKSAESANAKIKAIESQNDALVKERDAAQADAVNAEARAVKAEADLVERDVSALVGKKISPSEKDAFVELAKKDRPLFEKMVAQRSDMKLTEQKLADAPKPLEKSVGGADDLSDVLAEALA